MRSRLALLAALMLLIGCGETSDAATGGTSGTGGAGGIGGSGASGTGGDAGASGASGSGGTVDSNIFRVVIMADPHVIGPQYECCSESPGVDNTSIVKTEERLREVVGQLNAIEPRPSMVFVLGDIVHAAHHEHEAQWYQDNRNAFTVAQEVLAELEIPMHLLWGNHDYEVRCGRESFDRELSNQLFKDFFDSDPYHAVERGGWKFLFLNTQLGPSWDTDSERCNTSSASFGEEQLEWVAEQMDEGMPTVIMSHHPSAFWSLNEAPDMPDPDMPTLLGRYENDVVRFSGHMHRWITFPATNEFVVGATRYDTDNFWLVEFDGNDGTYRILDQDKAIELSTCAQTFSYEGTPMPVDDAVETGDCVVGL